MLYFALPGRRRGPRSTCNNGIDGKENEGIFTSFLDTHHPVHTPLCSYSVLRNHWPKGVKGWTNICFYLGLPQNLEFPRFIFAFRSVSSFLYTLQICFFPPILIFVVPSV